MKKYLMVFLMVLLFSTAVSAQTQGYMGLFDIASDRKLGAYVLCRRDPCRRLASGQRLQPCIDAGAHIVVVDRADHRQNEIRSRVPPLVEPTNIFGRHRPHRLGGAEHFPSE